MDSHASLAGVVVMSTQPGKAKSIFLKALEIVGTAERRAFLVAECANDQALRSDVEGLLQHVEQLGSFLEAVPREMPFTADEASTERSGTVVGPYKLLQEIGEGGMGTVWMAEQTQPVQRKVALKIIKAGMDSRHVLARFEAERQALALMDHPHIAKVHDGGATTQGRPYFAMELVKGQPMTKYCDEHRLTLKERLQLFVPVCQAIQHAHQKGIIHRDIKPSNVLVAPYDGQPVVKVIDFGVAKAMGQRLTDKTLFTEFGSVVGTLEYMSPEQAELNNQDIDTRSDIYSLGVLLYELLTGTTPLDRSRLKDAAFVDLLRAIREEEPPRPSTRLSEARDTLPTVSTQRQMDPAKLTKLVRGELDWIVMKALEKDRSRRYETANGFAQDVQRYLADEPVTACPPSALYRARKFGRRHKVPVLAAGVVLLSLVVGIVGTSWGAARADQARQRETLRADGERQAKEYALQAWASSEARQGEREAVLDFVESKILAAARPKGRAGGLGPEVTLRQAIEAALPYVEQSFANKPLIEARLRRTLAISFSYLGEPRIAVEQSERARALYLKHLGPEHRDTLWTTNNLAVHYGELGRHADAARLHEELLAVRQAQNGPQSPNTLQSSSNLAIAYAYLGRYADAARLNEEALAVRKSTLGPEHVDTVCTMHNLAEAYLGLGRHADALKLFEEALPLLKAKLGPDHPDTLECMCNLAVTYDNMGRSADALKLFEEALPLDKAKLGRDHPQTLRIMHALANCYARASRYAEALKLHEEALALRKAKLGPNHPDTLSSMTHVAGCHSTLNRHAEALKLLEHTLALQKATVGPDHPTTLLTMYILADSLVANDRLVDGIKLLQETLALQKVKLGRDHPDTLRRMHVLAIHCDTAGRHAEAHQLREQTLPLIQAKLGPGHPDTLRILNSLAWGLANSPDLKIRDPARAVKLAKEAVRLAPKEAAFWNTLGVAHLRAGAWEDACTTVEQSMEIGKGGDANDWLPLAIAHWQLAHREEARKWYDRAVQWMEKHPTKDEDLRRFRAEAEQLLGMRKNKE
jgi:serine/threonine protein kinase/tetratricopeptide (TPR) repeat protein